MSALSETTLSSNTQPQAVLFLQVMSEIVQRTASGLVAEGMPFQGVLFAGLMIKDGKVHYTSHFFNATNLPLKSLLHGKASHDGLKDWTADLLLLQLLGTVLL